MRNIRTLIGLCLGTIALGACGKGGFDNICDYQGACDAPDGGGEAGDGSVLDGGPGDGGGGDVAPLGCDASKDPKDSPACVDDTFGVFVSPTGSDTPGAGTKALPVATIAHAATLTTSAKSRVYVCEGTYPSAIALDATHDGVSIYGGFDCASWAFASKSVKIAPAASAAAPPALTIKGFTKSASFEDLEVDAPNGTAPGDSSIAALVTGSSSITFKRVVLAAGTGVTGTSGAAGAVGTPTPADLSGINAGATGSNADKACTCSSGGTSTGGFGGVGPVAPAGTGDDGKIAQAVLSPAGATGVGGTAIQCANVTPTGGVRGSDAPTGGDALKLTTSGKLDATGWHPANGTTGVSGVPGQGGGGGGGAATSQGGGGACGGCGASGGTGGAGGGASIALAVLASTVTVNASTLSTKKAGDGGGGAGGGTGQAGGARGSASGTACNGGNGGTGGNGGAGSGGSGGIVVGVLYSGTKPTVDPGTTAAITLGGAGAAGAGGKTPALDGKPGLTAPVQDATLL